MNQENLYSKIYDKENLLASWQEVKKNKGAGGVDFQTIDKVEAKLEDVINGLQDKLKDNSYYPKPVRRVYIPKPNGKQRPIGIPTVQDRIVQQATRSIIEPILDPKFEESSYGFCPDKSAKQALAKVEELLQQKQRWAVQIDLESFFDIIPHEIIIKKLKEYIQDERIGNLIKNFLKSGVMEEGNKRPTTTGTPQGGVISPLLANLVLDTLDKYAKSHGYAGIVRYADDFVILTKTKGRARHIAEEAIRVLNKLGLKVNQDKTSINHVSETFTFLGYTFGGGRYYKGEGGTKISDIWKRPSDKAIKIIKDKIRTLTRRQQPRNIAMLIEKLNPVIRGWYNYFKHGRNKSRFEDLDGWYRMRLRSFIHKKKSYQDNSKYPNSYFRELGYLFLADLFSMSITELNKPKQIITVQLTMLI